MQEKNEQGAHHTLPDEVCEKLSEISSKIYLDITKQVFHICDSHEGMRAHFLDTTTNFFIKLLSRNIFHTIKFREFHDIETDLRDILMEVFSELETSIKSNLHLYSEKEKKDG